MELTWRKRLWKMGDTLFHKMTFEEAAAFNVLRLYAGDIPAKPLYENQGFIGLSIKQADWNTIKHDITRPFPLKDNTVDFFQAEDVLEHIPYEALPAVLPRYTASQARRALPPLGAGLPLRCLCVPLPAGCAGPHCL